MDNEAVLKSISSPGGEAELHLTASEIVMGLSQATHDEAAQKLQQARAQLGGGWLARLVGGALNLGERALNYHAAVPLSNVRSARVENGELKFDYVSGPPRFGFGQIKVNGKDALKSFSEADLHAFAEAVNAQLSAQPSALSSPQS